MMRLLIDYIEDSELKNISIIGMAKNAGKTVTLNNIIKEAYTRDYKLAILSYGRDGEEVDAITNQKKPRIYIPPKTVFITSTKAYAKSIISAELLIESDINTLMGKVNIYKTGENGAYCELVGVNSVKQVDKIKELIPDYIDLFLIDGALDRKSSAMPEISEGFILATGAIAGDNEEEVVNNTIDEIEKLSFDQINNMGLKHDIKIAYSAASDGVIDYEDNLKLFSSDLSFNNIEEIKEISTEKDIKAVILNGALVDSFIEELRPFNGLRNSKIIVKDGTKIFLNRQKLNILKKYNIKIMVAKSLKLLGITVNPVSPSGLKLNSDKIIDGLKVSIKGVPVLDLMDKKYKELSFV